MNKKICFSVYISHFDEQKQMLESFSGEGTYVFTSFLINGKVNDDYFKKAKEMCAWLNEHDFKIIGDVNEATLTDYNVDSLIDFAKEYGVDVLRLDHGFTSSEIINISKEITVCINASTLSEQEVKDIVSGASKVFAMHNFYPRIETGLDSDVFIRNNNQLVSQGISPIAFIPCDLIKRGPVFGGLSTLESHRYIFPYCAFIDLAENYGIDQIFAADVCMSQEQLDLIHEYLKTDVIGIPVHLTEKNEWLYNQVFTIRIDSASCAFRLEESRMYPNKNAFKDPMNCVKREIGTITLDNINYSGYTGEVQIIKKELPQDDRVNVIGNVDKDYIDMLYSIANGRKIKLLHI